VSKRTIYKYQIPAIPGRHKVEMAPASDVIAIQPQGNFITLWAIVNLDHKDIRIVGEELVHTFQVTMTGEEFTDIENGARLYMGTCQFNGGAWALHLFRILEP
jgi:hypothetical protein